MKHTPGPWIFDGDVVLADHGIQPHICSLGSGDAFAHGTDEGQANGVLLAAAPELLAACEWFLKPDHPIGSHAELVHKFTEKAKAAIAKAKGTEA